MALIQEEHACTDKSSSTSTLAAAPAAGRLSLLKKYVIWVVLQRKCLVWSVGVHGLIPCAFCHVIRQRSFEKDYRTKPLDDFSLRHLASFYAALGKAWRRAVVWQLFVTWSRAVSKLREVMKCYTFKTRRSINVGGRCGSVGDKEIICNSNDCGQNGKNSMCLGEARCRWPGW